MGRDERGLGRSRLKILTPELRQERADGLDSRDWKEFGLILGLAKDVGFAVHSCVTEKRGNSEFLDRGKETQIQRCLHHSEGSQARLSLGPLLSPGGV